MSTLLVLLAAGLLMWALRASAIVVAGGRTVPAAANRALGYAKHAVLAAIVMTSLRAGVAENGSGYLPEIAAAAGAMCVGLVTRGMVRTMVVGMGLAALLAALLQH